MSPPPTNEIFEVLVGSASTLVETWWFGPKLSSTAAAVRAFITDAVAAGTSELRSNKTSPVSEFRTTACKVPREGLVASSVTEQVLSGASEADGEGEALSEADGSGAGVEKASPPIIKVRMSRPEPAPMKTSL